MKISLSKKYYSVSSIERSMEEFSKIAVFILNQEEKTFILEIERIQENLKKNFCEEFCNYLLSEMSREVR